MASLLEKTFLDYGPLCMDLDRARDITLVISTCLAYFLQEELELPLPAKPLGMVLAMKLGYFLAIF